MWSRYSATTHGVFTVARASHLPYLPYKPYVPYQSYLSDSGDREDREGREDREDHGDTETFQKRIKKENNITSSSPPLSTATGIPSQTSTIPYHTMTTMVIIRDPFKRFVSAFRSKFMADCFGHISYYFAVASHTNSVTY